MPKNLKMYANHLKMYASGVFEYKHHKPSFVTRFSTPRFTFLRAVDFFLKMYARET